jgi:6-phosphogluconate dehydrogenase
MRAAIIGLGKMGSNMARRLINDGHEIIGFNRTPQVTNEMAEEDGLIPAFSIEETVEKLSSHKVVWIMVPAGDPTEDTIDALSSLLEKEDIIIDGGNSNYKVEGSGD